jgi:hypothetical protein
LQPRASNGVSVGSGANGSGGAGDTFSAGGSAAGGSGGAAGGAGGSAAGAGGGGATGSAGAAGLGSGGGSGAQATAGGHQPVELGVFGFKNEQVNTVEHGLGNTSGGNADSTAIWKAVVNDLNAHGG